MESSLALKGHKDQMKKDYQVRVDALRKQLEKSNFEGERSNIQKDIDQLDRAYALAFERIDKSIEMAEGIEVAKNAEKEAKRVSEELELKNKALREWVRAGGDPNLFESSWATIRDSILNEKVIASLTSKNDGSNSPSNRKAITL